jgi:hypothetical protein
MLADSMLFASFGAVLIVIAIIVVASGAVQYDTTFTLAPAVGLGLIGAGFLAVAMLLFVRRRRCSVQLRRYSLLVFTPWLRCRIAYAEIRSIHEGGENELDILLKSGRNVYVHFANFSDKATLAVFVNAVKLKISGRCLEA